MNVFQDSSASENPSSAAPAFDSTARRDYIRFQLCIWGFFWVIGLASFLWDASRAEIRPYIALLKTFEIALMALCSHALWTIGRRRNWFNNPGTARRRGFAACLLGAAIVTAISLPLNLLVYQTAPDPRFAQLSLPVLVIGHWLGACIGLAIWGGLYSAYYYQAKSRLLETERARLLAATREAQLMALKGQINSHFLFNSLNTLRALIQREPATARSAVTHLADMMRHSLTLSAHPVIRLSAEIDFVNDYLALEHLRHENRLRIQKTITPEALGANIPPMLVQTLVENAVKHGLSQSGQGIVVTCEITVAPPPPHPAPDAAPRLHLRVTNQGRLRPGAAKVTGTTGTGLRNIRERLRLLYGERASLAVTESGGFVVAEAIVPFETPVANTAGRETAPPPDPLLSS